MHKPPMVAGGDIRPARFVKISTAADYTLLEADANERIFGIAENASQDAPIPSADADAADAGDSFNFYMSGEECLLELGSGGVTRGGMLISDADGKGVAAATTGTTVQWIGAEAIESGSAGEKVRVIVRNFPYRPALV
jgi:hypothetical protein